MTYEESSITLFYDPGNNRYYVPLNLSDLKKGELARLQTREGLLVRCIETGEALLLENTEELKRTDLETERADMHEIIKKLQNQLDRLNRFFNHQ